MEAKADRRPALQRRDVALLLMDVVVPVAGYYLLRVVGVEPLPALVAAAVPTAVLLIWQACKKRKLDALGLFVLILLVVSVCVSFITGSPRFLLAKGGWVTAVVGIGFLVTLLLARPLAYTLARALLQRSPMAVKFRTDTWDSRWEAEPAFRRPWRVATAMWGIGMLLDAAARVLMAYTLPIDIVPAVAAALWGATFVGLQVVQHLYFARIGLWRGPAEQPDGTAGAAQDRGTYATASTSMRRSGLDSGASTVERAGNGAEK